MTSKHFNIQENAENFSSNMKKWKWFDEMGRDKEARFEPMSEWEAAR